MTKKLLFALVLSLLTVGFAMPAVAAPCCQDCGGWGEPEDFDELCWRWCVFCRSPPEADWLKAEPAACTTTTDEHWQADELPAPQPEDVQPTA